MCYDICYQLSFSMFRANSCVSFRRGCNAASNGNGEVVQRSQQHGALHNSDEQMSCMSLRWCLGMVQFQLQLRSALFGVPFQDVFASTVQTAKPRTNSSAELFAYMSSTTDEPVILDFGRVRAMGTTSDWKSILGRSRNDEKGGEEFVRAAALGPAGRMIPRRPWDRAASAHGKR